MKKVLVLILASPIIAVTLLFSHFQIISQNQNDIAPEFRPLYYSFLTEAHQRGFTKLDQINISIQFNDLNQVPKENGNTTLGQCTLLFGQNPEIKIDRDSWATMNHTKKEMTIFHELGHCFLLKGHSNGHHHQIISLMNTNMFSPQEYELRRTQLLDEMFSYKPYHLTDYVQTFVMEPTARGFKKLMPFIK